MNLEICDIETTQDKHEIKWKDYRRKYEMELLFIKETK